MTRPSPEAVEDALTTAGFYHDDEPLNVLALELMHLREVVARCSELPTKWRAKAIFLTAFQVSDDLEQALRDEP